VQALGPEGGPFEGYVPRFEIGRGNYGSVYLLQHPDTGSKAVDKRIRMDTLSEKETKQALAEIELLRMLKHPHIVNFRHTFTSEPSEAGPGLWSGRHCSLLHILMDYCDGGTLADVLTDAKKLTPPQLVPIPDVKRWARQCLLALAHLHEHRILHRDLKPANVLLVKRGGDPDAVLGDFGISRVLSPDTMLAKTAVGTPYYMSPEAISGTHAHISTNKSNPAYIVNHAQPWLSWRRERLRWQIRCLVARRDHLRAGLPPPPVPRLIHRPTCHGYLDQ
jgi:NIMA (never in mitosis gene a)-related kinase